MKIRRLKSAACCLTAIAAVSATFLGACQGSLIYYPRPYDADYVQKLHGNVVELQYRTSCGNQHAFYVPPADEHAPQGKLWVLFGGNGSLALDWLPLIRRANHPSAGFLLVDYPGYGKCEGKSTVHRILENSEGAFKALAEHTGTTTDELEQDLQVMGHSLGAAAALQFAVKHPVRRVILVSPFTTMRDMANRVVGRQLGSLLTHRYDNRARLAELAARATPPPVDVIHGDADPVIPIEMSRRLAAEFPSMITLHEIKGGDHVDILDDAMSLPVLNQVGQ